ncbi:MAG: amidohydrolase [Lachnospiraceae bacterium]|nr:amidohydrolase [Candidatus Equihabitans merdae]
MGILIKNVQLWDEEIGKRRNIYIEGSRITGIDQEPEHFSEDETIDGSHKVMMPGFVNAHTHAYMSVFRNYADDLPFAEWLFEKIDPLESNLTSEQAYWGNMLSIIEMIRTGTTCFVDMHMFPEMAVKACADSGIRGVITRGLVGSDRNDEACARRVKEALDEIDYAANEPAANVTFGLGPHAIYTAGEDVLRYVAELAKEKGLFINIHATETPYEYETCLKEHGKTPIAYLKDCGILDGPALLAHCVYLDDEDYAILRESGASVATNPASNMKLGNGFAPVARMLDEGINVCLGTDGASSNNALNMFRELNLLTLTQKGVTKDTTALNAETTMKIAVENGYKAVGLGKKGGKIEKGRIADVILLDEEAPNFQPKFNWKAAFAYSASGYEVSDVLVAGKVLMRNRILTTIDEERVNYEIAKAVSKF